MNKLTISINLILFIFCKSTTYAQVGEELALIYLSIVETEPKENKKQLFLADINKDYGYGWVCIDSMLDEHDKYAFVICDMEDIDFYIFKQTQIGWKKIFYSDSLELESRHFQDIRVQDFNNDGLKDILIVGSDGGYRSEQNNLLLFNKQKDTFKIVAGIPKLGYISQLSADSKYFYSYYGCGCAGDCWISHLFVIENDRLKILGKLGCDCDNFKVSKKINEGYQDSEVYDSCKDFEAYNFDEEKKWKELIAGGFIDN